MKSFFSSGRLALCAMAFALSAGPALSQTLDLSTLPEPARKEILRQLQAAEQPAAPVSIANTEKDKEIAQIAREWGGLGQAVASGIVSAAREVGVAANEFATSPLGKITLAVLLWKYLGAQVVGIIFGSIIMCGGMLFGWRMVKRAALLQETTEYAQTPILWGLLSLKTVQKRELKVESNGLEESQVAQQIIGYLLMAASFVAGLIAIF